MSKKGENIYKRKDNRWEARYIKSHTSDGKILYGYCYGQTYREAKEKMLQAISIGDTENSENNNRPFSAYIDEWLIVNKTNIKETTYVKSISTT